MSLQTATILFGSDGETLPFVATLNGPSEGGGAYDTTHSSTTGSETMSFNELEQPQSFSIDVPSDTAAQVASAEAITINLSQTLTITQPSATGGSTRAFTGACIGRVPSFNYNARNIYTLEIQRTGAIT